VRPPPVGTDIGLLAAVKRHPRRSVLVHLETDPLVPAPSSVSWWDVPVAAVSRLDSTRRARKAYQAAQAGQRNYPNEPGGTVR
jgi:TPP-dependent trihydroxycyclohexane-1,2-dione (THcHDO) dehydratase